MNRLVIDCLGANDAIHVVSAPYNQFLNIQCPLQYFYGHFLNFCRTLRRLIPLWRHFNDTSNTSSWRQNAMKVTYSNKLIGAKVKGPSKA